MSCTDLGFDDQGNLRLSKSCDVEETLTFPTSYDFTGYSGELQIRATEDAASALLTIGTTATVSGSVISFSTRYVSLTVKAGDTDVLPETAEPWVGVYEWVLTDPSGLTTRLVRGSLIAEKGVVR